MKAAAHIYLLPLLGLSLAALQLNEAAASTTIGVCYSKPDNTILAVEGSCTTYIYCLTEQAIVLPCPNGTAFSATARGCIEKSQADCFLEVAATTTPPTTSSRACLDNEQRPENQAACVGQSNGQLVAYPGNCSLYLVCDCEYPTVMKCAPGTWFNPKTDICDWPQNVPSCNGDGTQNTTPTITTTTQQPIETCNDLPAGLNGTECQSEKDGTLLRYPYDCNAYVNCTIQCPVLNYCIPGKVFNDLLKICDTPDTAKCEELQLPTTTEATTPTTTTEATTTPTTTTEATTTPTTTTEGTTTPTTTTTEATTPTTTELTTPTTEATTLPSCVPPVGISGDLCQIEEGLLHSYPHNCNAYVNCTDGCPFLDYCGLELVYNSALQICDTPDTAYCKEVPLPPTTTPLPPNMDEICQNERNGTLLEYETDCASYIECINEKPYIQQCPDGWLFNSALMICDLSKDVDCDSQKTSTTSLPPTASTPVYEECIGQKKNVTFPYPDDCQKYYYCWGNDTSSIFPCPQNNWYNPYTGNCGPDVSVTACRQPTTTTAATVPTTKNPADMCKGEAFGTSFPIDGNCQQYYYCVGNGPPIILDCPNDNYFNPLTGKCGPLASVCPNGPTVPTTTATTPTTTVQPTPRPPLPTTVTTPQPPLTNICGNSNDGAILAYPNSCTKYIVCQQPVPIALECPNNWYFNAATKECDLPENVKCENGSGGSTTTSPGGSTTPTTTVSPTDNTCMGLAVGQTLPYDKNCQLFIECLGANLWMYKSCAADEYYDPVTNKCGNDVAPTACQATEQPTTVSPTKPPIGPCAGIEDGNMIAYPNNCSKYIVCETPISIGKACDLGLEFNAATQQCTDPEDAGCSFQSTTETSTTTTASSVCQNATSWDTFPYTKDCSMYIICVDGAEKLIPCPEGYYNPDPDIRSCDKNVSETYCTGNGNGTISTEESTGTATPPMSPGTTTPVPTPGFPVGPCYEQPNGMLIEYPNNCSKYIICVMPIPIGYDCQPDYAFDSESRRCEPEDLANCGVVKTSITNPLPTTTTTPLTTITVPASEYCDEAENGETYPYLPDCSQFYICIEGKPVQGKCLPDWYYNPASSQCENDISNTTCRETVTPTASTTFTMPTTTTTEITAPTTTLNPYTPNVCCGIPLGTSIPYPNVCNRYVYCQYPVPIVVYCSTGEMFDKTQAKCIQDTEEQCNSDGYTHDNVNETTTLDPTTLGTTSDPTVDPTKPNSPTTSDPTSRTTLDPTSKTTLDPTSGTTLDPTIETTYSNSASTSNPTLGTPRPPPKTTLRTTLDPASGTTLDPTVDTTYSYSTVTSDPTIGTPKPPKITLDPASGTTLDPTVRTTYSYSVSTSIPTIRTPRPPPKTTFRTTLDPTSGTTLDPTVETTYPNSAVTSDPTVGIPKTTLDPTSGTTLDPTVDTTHSYSVSTPNPTIGTPRPPPKTTLRTTVNPTSTTSKTTTITSTSSTTISPDNVTKNAQVCINAAAGTQKEYFGDCTKYNFCFLSTSMVLSCQTNWYYNPKLKECVPKSSYQCPW